MNQKELGILFLDDDIELLEGYKELFSNVFNVFTTNSPENAMKIIDKYNIGVVICDYYMPMMSGNEFLTKLLKKDLLIRRILISGKMDVNIAMESIDLSKVHKILTKPFVIAEFIEEIKSQLKIFTSQTKDNLQALKYKDEIRSAFELYEFQSQELFSIINAFSKNTGTIDYSILMPEIVNLTLDYSKRFIDIYLKNQRKDPSELEYVKQNSMDLKVIANAFNLYSLYATVLISQIYLSLLEGDNSKARTLYNQVAYYTPNDKADDKLDLKRNINKLLPLLKSNSTSSDMSCNEDLMQGLTNLFDHKIQESLKLEIINQDEFAEQSKHFAVIIMKENSVVFVKNKLTNIDLEKFFISIDLFQNLSMEIQQRVDMFQSIYFSGYNIQISVIGAFKYILISSNETIFSRIKLRNFIVETINIAKTIPILRIPNKEDVKHINNLAKELFDI